jgi:hypothetical protein
MNQRIFDLIKNPEAVQIKDLDLLKKELKKYPYVQHIRALHLYGIHLHQPENYQKELSVTAAYTTDKKILYHFINKKSIAENSKIEVAEVVKEVIPETLIENHLHVTETASESSKPVVIDGVLNRILFEGEEGFWEKENETLDLESTDESGTLVTQKTVEQGVSSNSEDGISEKITAHQFPLDNLVTDNLNLEIRSDEEFNDIENAKTFALEITDSEENFTDAESAENYSLETLTEEKNDQKEVPAVADSSQISFHGAQEFLPQVKIIPQKIELKTNEISPSKQSKQEEEMQRLLAQVEAKIKASKRERNQKPEIEIVSNSTINFAETQEFKTEVPREQTTEFYVETQEITESITKKVDDQSSVPDNQKENVWKPMIFPGNKPDSAPEKTSPELPPIEYFPDLSEKEDSLEERPAFNVSFFATDLSPIAKKEEQTIVTPTPKPEEESESVDESNFPKFLNTWQNWLKIERKEETLHIIGETEISKETVIENFIQKEPKISKLKEESNFVAKEKHGNISHLMTETLANLYIDQKLYSVAIKAYETLGDKYPAKKEYYADKILEIKELRKNP